MMADRTAIRIVGGLSLPVVAALVILATAFILAAPVSAQAEVMEDPSAEAEETLEPGSTNGHELDTLGEDSDLPADGDTADGSETDAEVGGVRLSFVLFIIGIGAALVFLFLFFQKFILRKP